MAITAQLHDGTRLEFPDGTDPAVIQSTVKKVMAGQVAQPPKQDAVVSAGQAIMDVPRQVGLTARAGIKGVLALPGVVVDAGTGLYNEGADLVAGKGNGPRFQTAASSLDKALSMLGLPEPRTPTERVVQDGASMMMGAGSMAKGSEILAKGAKGLTQNVLQKMAANTTVQVVGGAGSGMAGGSVREAGGGAGAQFLASLAGGVGAGMAASGIGNAAKSAGSALQRAITPQAVQMQQVDQQISLTLQRSGIDWAAVPERIKQGLRAEVGDALQSGQPLNADALRRLLVFRRAEVTPTVGQLTQDPGQITREMNLAKTGANSTDAGLQRLPALQNTNTASLLRQLDEAGARGAPSTREAGSSAISSLGGVVERETAATTALYNKARDSGGRSLPLNGGVFNQRVSQLLDDANVGSQLPKDIQNKINAIAAGKGGFEFNVNSAEQLKTSIGDLQRGSSEGNVRKALGLVRQALDETPLLDPSKAGKESIAAFNAARSSHRNWMTRVEANPALKAVVEGVEPDQFIQKFLIEKGASVSSVNALRQDLGTEGAQAIRQALVKHLKDKATGGDSDVVKFGGKTYRDAFRAIEDKLGAFFDADEIQKMRDIGDAAKYMQAQPAGAAVNNSNSGALMLGRGLEVLDKIANFIPLGGKDVIKGKISGMQQTQVLKPKNALMQITNTAPQPIRVNPLLAAAVVSTPAESRDKNRRN